MATNPARVFYPVSGELFAAILEQRMAQHKLWQHAAEYALMEDIISESQSMPKRRQKTPWLFELLPGHVQASVVVDLERKQ